MKASREVSDARASAAVALKAAGFTIKDISNAIGVSASRVNVLVGGHRAVNVRDEQREQEMESLYRGGMVLDAIGAKVGLSRERVRQILARRGVTYADARGKVVAERQELQARQQEFHRKARWNKHTQRHYGCTLDEAVAINDGHSLTRGACRAYTYQRRNAESRGIGWEITLPEWWRVWQESGKWPQRGRGKGKYCMSRTGDSGPYCVANVRITTNESNASESYDTKPAEIRFGPRFARDELGLTPSQRAVYDLMQVGINTAAIAAQLGIKVGTARTVACSIRQKFGVYESKYGKAA